MFNHGFETHSLPSLARRYLAAFPSVSLFPQLGSLITRMVHKEMLPTKHAKHTSEAESAS
jgi:hypothetical protein